MFLLADVSAAGICSGRLVDRVAPERVQVKSGEVSWIIRKDLVGGGSIVVPPGEKLILKKRLPVRGGALNDLE